jgi:hypothetical protein
MRRWKWNRLSGLVLLAPLLTGCGWMNAPTFRTPSLLHPGPAAYQQRSAVQFDPYPSKDLGPEVAGFRPHGYRVPPNEVTQGQRNLPWGNWRGHGQ